ncbi:MAG: hypothetical protein J7L94_12220, partial [Caldisericaceae bacterium]|nr:hypothetical protein [Caldisericaceae bacterium]
KSATSGSLRDFNSFIFYSQLSGINIRQKFSKSKKNFSYFHGVGKRLLINLVVQKNLNINGKLKTFNS